VGALCCPLQFPFSMLFVIFFSFNTGRGARDWNAPPILPWQKTKRIIEDNNPCRKKVAKFAFGFRGCSTRHRLFCVMVF